MEQEGFDFWLGLDAMQKRSVGVCIVFNSNAMECSLSVVQWEGHPLSCFPAVTYVSGRTRLDFSLILPSGMEGAHTFPPGIIKLPFFVYSVFLTKYPLCGHGFFPHSLFFFFFFSPQHKKIERWKECNMVDD